MKNVMELQKELSDLFINLKEGDVEPKVASEMNNTAGKIINSIKVQLEYATLIGKTPNVKFLNEK